jgi:hypothetical protein
VWTLQCSVNVTKQFERYKAVLMWTLQSSVQMSLWRFKLDALAWACQSAAAASCSPESLECSCAFSSRSSAPSLSSWESRTWWNVKESKLQATEVLSPTRAIWRQKDRPVSDSQSFFNAHLQLSSPLYAVLIIADNAQERTGLRFDNRHKNYNNHVLLILYSCVCTLLCVQVCVCHVGSYSLQDCASHVEQIQHTS